MFLRTLSLAIPNVADRTRVIFTRILAHSEGLFLFLCLQELTKAAPCDSWGHALVSVLRGMIKFIFNSLLSTRPH